MESSDSQTTLLEFKQFYRKIINFELFFELKFANY